MNLLLIRHAETKQDSDGPSREWHLTERAYAACEDLAERLRERNLGRIVTSEEVKAKETGRVLAEHLGVPWSIALNLHEHERTGVLYLEQEVWLARLESFFKNPDDLILGNETGTQARRRFDRAVREVLKDYPIAVPRHTETDERRYHHRMCVLDVVSSSERASNQMIPATNKPLAIVTHASVISLFVAHYNDIDVFTFWQGLEMPDEVVLSVPGFSLESTHL